MEPLQNPERFIGAIVDALGFELAIPIRPELTHAVKDGEELALIRPGWPDLIREEGRTPDAWIAEDLAAIVAAASKSIPFRHAFADAQRAIDCFDDTAFYCYRALESRCTALAGEAGGDRVSAATWQVMRDTPSMSRDQIDAIKEHATSAGMVGALSLPRSSANSFCCLSVARSETRRPTSIGDRVPWRPDSDGRRWRVASLRERPDFRAPSK